MVWYQTIYHVAQQYLNTYLKYIYVNPLSTALKNQTDNYFKKQYKDSNLHVNRSRLIIQ